MCVYSDIGNLITIKSLFNIPIIEKYFSFNFLQRCTLIKIW